MHNIEGLILAKAELDALDRCIETAVEAADPVDEEAQADLDLAVRAMDTLWRAFCPNR